MKKTLFLALSLLLVASMNSYAQDAQENAAIQEQPFTEVALSKVIESLRTGSNYDSLVNNWMRSTNLGDENYRANAIQNLKSSSQERDDLANLLQEIADELSSTEAE